MDTTIRALVAGVIGLCSRGGADANSLAAWI